MTREQVVQAARGWIGTAFRPQGRRRSGIDCIGLIVVVARDLDIPHTDYSHYTQWPDPNRRLIAVLDEQAVLQAPTAPWPGTIGLFASPALPCHVTITSMRHGVRHIIHASTTARAVLEQPLDSQGLRLLRRYGFRELES